MRPLSSYMGVAYKNSPALVSLISMNYFILLAGTHVGETYYYENCALLAYYAVSCGDFLPTFRDKLSFLYSKSGGLISGLYGA
jgi:hypothetical protein